MNQREIAFRAELAQNIAMSDAIARLQDNPDFKLVVLEKFCTTDCARFVALSTDLNMPLENRADALASAQAAGYFKRYINYQQQLGENSRAQLEQLDAPNGDDDNIALYD